MKDDYVSHRASINPNAPGARIAAAHETILLVNRWPELWPLLNELTLIQHRHVDWVTVLETLEQARLTHLEKALSKPVPPFVDPYRPSTWAD